MIYQGDSASVSNFRQDFSAQKPKPEVAGSISIPMGNYDDSMSRHSSPQKEGGEPSEDMLSHLRGQRATLKKLLENYRAKIKYANDNDNESQAVDLRKEAKLHEE